MSEQSQDQAVDSKDSGEENKLIAERRAKLAVIREKRNAFPNSFRRDSYAEALQQELGEKDKEALEQLDRPAHQPVLRH